MPSPTDSLEPQVPASVPTWATARSEALARLAPSLRRPRFYQFHEQLLDACADVLAASRERDLVFLGRSPENLYDLLRALLRGVRRAPRLRLLPFSCRVLERYTAYTLPDRAVTGIERHLVEAGIDFESLYDAGSGICVVDCVCWGTTFANFEDLLNLLCMNKGLALRYASETVHYVGLTTRGIGWTHWKHDEDSGGTRLFRQDRARVVPISRKLWNHLAGPTPKTTLSFTPEHWDANPQLSSLGPKSAQAATLAAELFCFGSDRDVRRAFAGKLSKRADKDRTWLRSLVVELQRSTRRKFSRR